MIDLIYFLEKFIYRKPIYGLDDVLLQANRLDIVRNAFSRFR